MATKYVVTGDQAIRIGNRMAEIQRQVFLQKEYAHDPEGLIRHLQSATEGRFLDELVFAPQVKIAEPEIIIPNFRTTGSTLADWLKAREELHKFFTGETIILRDTFVFTDEELASNTLIPAFRPAGATNREAILWKRKMGMKVYEEADVMRYTNSEELRRHTLCLINRSTRPDEDTLGDNAKSPSALIQVPNKLWIGLFGWCDTDTLHFAITEEHLDPATVTWFPEDRLPGGEVACGRWCDGRVRLSWNYAGSCRPDGGARSANEGSPQNVNLLSLNLTTPLCASHSGVFFVILFVDIRCPQTRNRFPLQA